MEARKLVMNHGGDDKKGEIEYMDIKGYKRIMEQERQMSGGWGDRIEEGIWGWDKDH